MILMGSLINLDATDDVVNPHESWCKFPNVDTIQNNMPQGFDVVTALTSAIFPILPLVINSQTKQWNDFKIEMVKSHAMGQGSVFGAAELLRHFVIIPEPKFLEKCNISQIECEKKVLTMATTLLDDKDNNSFCRNSSNSNVQLFDSMHHFPDKVCCLIGASVVTFFANLYFWNRSNAKGKSIYEAHNFTQIILIVIQVTCVVLFLAYLYFQYSAFDSVQLYGCIIGALIQSMIICSTLPNKEN